MTSPPGTHAVAVGLREAYARRDLTLLGPLLADDVRWGEADHPRACRNRADVLRTYAAVMGEGAEGEVTELAEGSEGILCGLTVRWPEGGRRRGPGALYHVYVVRHGRIAEIRPFDDRARAAAAAGVEPGAP
ncbi:MAG TPA: nuclear transport factor 2 family protein [Acidimicrobiales bacterium]|nr:nuclear transport factor 2 family protein [Acidimicrobiales bacterium]